MVLYTTLDHRPVSGAVVTLYQNGLPVNTSKMGQASNLYGGPIQNPVISEYYSLENSNEGYYGFGYLYPGIYVVRVEKGQYNTSVTVNANISMAVYHGDIHVDIWLEGYHDPAWTRDQLSSNGSIRGIVYDNNGQIVWHPRVTLEQNGQIMNIPHNPMYTYDNGTYVFSHLLPGDYQVISEENGNIFPFKENLNKSSLFNVTVSNGTAHADLTLQYINATPYPTPHLPRPPSPSPAPITLVSIFAFLVTGYFIYIRRK